MECETLRLEVDDDEDRLVAVDRTDVLRIDELEIEHIQVMHHTTGEEPGEWSVVLVLTPPAWERVQSFAREAHGLIVTAKSDLVIATIDQRALLEGESVLSFVLSDAETLSRFQDQIGLSKGRIISDLEVDREDACRALAGEDEALFGRCMRLPDRAEAARIARELGEIESRLESGQITIEEAVDLLEQLDERSATGAR
jgi:hypothetical protein